MSPLPNTDNEVHVFKRDDALSTVIRRKRSDANVSFRRKGIESSEKEMNTKILKTLRYDIAEFFLFAFFGSVWSDSLLSDSSYPALTITSHINVQYKENQTRTSDKKK